MRTKPPFKWSFPGGGVEPGESAQAAATREAREEVFVDIEIVARASDRVVEVAEANRRYVIAVFAARIVSGEPRTGPEASEIGWFDIDKIELLGATEGLTESARDALRVFEAAKA